MIDSEARPDSAPENAPITNAEFRAHMARVESVFNLVEQAVRAMVEGPMAGFLPPDLVAEILGR